MNELNPLQLERFLLGELPRDEAQALQARLERDPALAARLEGMKAEDQAIRSALPAERVVPELNRRLHLRQVQDAFAARQRRQRTLAGGFGLLAVAAGTLLALRLGSGAQVSPFEPLNSGEVRPKGEEGPLLIHRAGRQGPELLRDGAQVREGDRLQMALRAGDARHGVLLSWDGAGVLTRHFPVDGATTRLPPGELTLPRSYVLDDAPGFERFLFVRSEGPLDVAALEAAAGRLAASREARSGALPCPADAEQFSVLLPKEGP
jgi:hypothetical protein